MCMPSLPLEWKLVVDQADNGKNQRMGNQDNDAIIPSKKTKRRDVGRLPYQSMQYGQKDMSADGIAFFVWANHWKYVACHGMGLRWKPECCDQHPQKSLQVKVRDGGIPYRQECWNGIHEITQDGSISGDGTMEGMCGIRSPQIGRAKKTGWKRERRKIHQRRSTSSSVSFWAKWCYPPNTEKTKIKTKRRG